jgi:hypothetical protein
MARLVDYALGIGSLKPITWTHKKRNGDEVELRANIRVLKKNELNQARLQAVHDVARMDPSLKEGKSYEELLEEARVVQVLARALVDTESPDLDSPRPWASPMELEAMLSTSEVSFLWKAYVEWQEENSPAKYSLTPEEYESFVKTAGEGNADFLVFFSSPTLKAFIISMAVELRTWRSASSSSTSPLEADSIGSESDSANVATSEVAPAGEG